MGEAQTKDIIPVHQIVAMDEENGIGIGENLPWNLPKDWNHFLRMTTKIKVFPWRKNYTGIVANTELCNIMSCEIYVLYLIVYTG